MCVLLAACVATPAAAMPKSVAVSAGSFFAAAAQCEAQKLITPGQAEALRQALDRYLSKSDRTNMDTGFARGAQTSEVFVVQRRRWSAFRPDDASCYRVQGVLDDYRGQLGAE